MQPCSELRRLQGCFHNCCPSLTDEKPTDLFERGIDIQGGHHSPVQRICIIQVPHLKIHMGRIPTDLAPVCPERGAAGTLSAGLGRGLCGCLCRHVSAGLA